MRIEIDKPKKAGLKLPMHIGAANFCQFRGLLMKSNIYFRGKMGLKLFNQAKARLILGDHPRIAPLKTLNLRPDPIFTAFFPASNGLLDDYFECWFLAFDQKPAQAPEGFESVIHLGLAEEWLAPPDRARVDATLEPDA